MFNACSTTARRGALDWAPIFEKANLPIFEKLYESVKNGTETRKSLEFNGRSTYREDLAKELKKINDQEIWRAGMWFFFYVRGWVTIFFLNFRSHRPFVASRCSTLVPSQQKTPRRCLNRRRIDRECLMDIYVVKYFPTNLLVDFIDLSITTLLSFAYLSYIDAVGTFR